MLLYFIAAFLLGLWFGSYLLYVPLTILVVLAASAASVTWFERKGLITTSNGLILYACLLFGVSYWYGGEWSRTQGTLLKQAGEEAVVVEGLIVEPVQHAPARVTMIIDVTSFGEGSQVRSAQGKLRLTWREPDTPVYRGDAIRFVARLRAPFGTQNPGGFDYGAYLRQRGIQAVSLVTGPGHIRISSSRTYDIGFGFWHQIDQWRDRVRQTVLSTLKDPARGLFLGMIVGEQSYIAPDVRDDFMTTGTVHIISISGSHLGLLAFLSFWTVRGVTRCLPAPWLERLSCVVTPKQLAVVVTIPLVLFYTLLSGAHVATVRSLMMILFYLLAVWMGHERHILIALGVSASLTTLYNPMALYDLSFQLSYLSVFAIAMVLRWKDGLSKEWETSQPLWTKTKDWLGQYLMIAIAATMATLPLVAYYFNQVAWLGVLANMVVVPFVGILVVPVGLLSSIIVLLGGGENLPLGMMQQGILDSLTYLINILAKVPGAEWHVASPSLLAIAGFYGCLVFVMMGKSQSLRWAGAGIVFLLIMWWVWSPRQIFEADTLRVTFLDVGQGDASVIELPDGQTVLVDGGARYERWDMGRMVVGPYLWDRGIRRIDHVIATHPQLDHVGGLAWIIQKFDVGQYWSNGVQRVEPFYQRLEYAIEEKGLVERVAWEGQDIVNGSSCQLRSLNPPQTETDPIKQVRNIRGGTELNNLSVVLNVTCGQHSILLTADAEVEALTRLTNNPLVKSATVVKIPHHGAKSSLNRSWIKQLTAQTAIVSAGQGNRYGHPAAIVLEQYLQKQIGVFRTDHDGAVWITVKPSKSEVTVQTAKDNLLEPVRPDVFGLMIEGKNLVRLWNGWIG